MQRWLWALAMSWWSALPLCAQTPPDACALLPDGASVDRSLNVLEDFERSAGLRAKCTVLSAQGSAIVIFYDDADKARAQVDGQRSGAEGGAGAIVNSLALGDGGIEIDKQQIPPGNPDSPVRFIISFSRGCALVSVYAGGVLGANYILDAAGQAQWTDAIARARSTAAAIDANLAAAGSCPEDGNQPPPPPPPLDGLGVSLNCIHEYADPGLVQCTATPNGQRGDAQLVYDWSYDGANQYNNADALRLTGVPPGDHSVSVQLRDAANGIDAAPQTVTFTKTAGSGSDAGSGDGLHIPLGGRGDGTTGDNRASGGADGSYAGDGDGPGTGTLIGIGVVLGGVALGAATRRRRRPPATASPPVTNSPPPPKPRPTAPPTARPTGPAERAGAKPVVPPIAAPRPVAPRPTGHPEPPPMTPGSRRGPQRQEGEIWLTTNQDAVEVRGDGKDGVAIKVQAWQWRDGIRVELGAEVTLTRVVSDAAKLKPRDLRGLDVFQIRALHAGNTRWRGNVRVEGRCARGPVAPALITVSVLPIAIEVRVRVIKQGFTEQQVVATLPTSVRRVDCRVLGPGNERAADAGRSVGVETMLPGASGDLTPVHDARAFAAMRIDQGAWTTEAQVRSDHGGFWFGLPPGFLALYPPEHDNYPLPQPLELAHDKDTRDGLTGLREARDDLDRDFATAAPDAAWESPRKALYAYSAQACRQLCECRESEVAVVHSAIHRLRAAVRFALKYRRDVRLQRQLIEISAEQSVGSLFDVATDLIPVAGKLFAWLGGKTQTIGPFKLAGFGTLVEMVAKAFEKGWARNPVTWALRFGVRAVRLLQRVVFDLTTDVLKHLLALAELAGVSRQALEALRYGVPGLPPPPPAADVNDVIATELSLLGRAIHELGECLVRVVALAMHFCVLLIAGLLKAVGRAIHAFPWDPQQIGLDSAIGEVIETALGEIANTLYSKFGSALDYLMHPVNWLGEPTALTGKSFAQVLLDSVSPPEMLDRECAQAMTAALSASLDLSLDADWRTRVETVSRQELAAMAQIERHTDVVSLLERWAPAAKLLVKLVQAVLFVWVSVGKTLLKLGGFLAGKLSDLIVRVAHIGDPDPRAPGPARAREADKVSARLEMLVDTIELVLVRVPILIRELLLLQWLQSTAARRIRDLYRDAGL